MSDDTVPFGKYRGKPVEDMLADTDYMAWLEGQPWFRARFAHLLARRDVEAANRTPAHNRLQAMFLDPVYQMAFVRVAEPAFLEACDTQHQKHLAEAPELAARETTKLLQKIETARADAAEDHDKGWKFQRSGEIIKAAEAEMVSLKQALAGTSNAKLEYKPRVVFEAKSDVLLTVEGRGLTLGSERVQTEWYIESYKWRACPWSIEAPATARWSPAEGLSIEIKPTVADDYPAVLRQMNRNKSRYLFVGRYDGEGATEAQFVAIFAASGKQVVFKRDVDAMATRLREGA